MDIELNPGPTTSKSNSDQLPLILNSTSVLSTNSCNSSSFCASLNCSSSNCQTLSDKRSLLHANQVNGAPHNFSTRIHDVSVDLSNLNSTLCSSSRSRRIPEITYSSADLYKFHRQSTIKTPNCCSLLKELNIFRFRGKRAGRRFRRNSSLVNKTPSETASIPSSKDFIRFCLLNTRSLNKKTLRVKDYIVEHNFDIFAVTETWLKDDSDFEIRDVCPSGYSISHLPRKNRSGGGVAVIYRNSFNVKLCESAVYNSFESIELKFRSHDQVFCVVVVYRPPSSSFGSFIQDFSSLLEPLSIYPGKLLICGDFNVHVDDKNDNSSKKFLDLLDCFSLHCIDTTSPTHKKGHALDLLITRTDDVFLRNFFIHDPVLSDHFAVHCSLSAVKPICKSRTVSYRKICSIDLDAFRHDIAESLLCKSPATELSALCHQYDAVLAEILNKHAPLRTKIISTRPRAPWYNDVIRENKTKRRRLERRWRKTKLTIDKELYEKQRKIEFDLIYVAKMSYYSKLIDDSGCDNKTLFSTINKLLHRTPERKLPTTPSTQVLVNNFAHFFKDKITTIRDELSTRVLPDSDIFVDLDSPSKDCCLDSFMPVNDEDVFVLCKKLLSKSCSLDPIPADLCRQNLGLLLPVICKIVNLSLKSGSVPSTLKTAVLRPLLKKPSLNHEIFKNYRPISNLKMVSKVIEKVVHNQLNAFLSLNNLYEPFQSAYRPYHSCETALLRISDDILQSLDRRQCVAMLFLDLSAAFDTVDHSILLNRLRYKFGVSGSALQWFKSYLSNRHQFVSIDNVSSDSLPLGCGVPQGSVLGPFSSSHNMKLNPLKCKEMLINFMNNPNFAIRPINIGDIVIDCVTSCKILGVYLDYNLKWNSHIDYIEKKAS
ncbi:RNA-directed DNA polymerase from mobile element jockey [Exaiptasia diaphana]|nr:RNA-directed DNA polymerase from mobile element jockey [Exaiptasia diaphana]